jgi:hypothetical protein
MLAVMIKPGDRRVFIARELQPDGTRLRMAFTNLENLTTMFPGALWQAEANEKTEVIINGEFMSAEQIAALGNNVFENVYGEI